MQSETKTWPCCDESSCARAEIVRAFSPDRPIELDVDKAATAVARVCPTLDKRGLEHCFTRTFEVPPECQLFDRFCVAYGAERDRTE